MKTNTKTNIYIRDDVQLRHWVIVQIFRSVAIDLQRVSRNFWSIIYTLTLMLLHSMSIWRDFRSQV